MRNKLILAAAFSLSAALPMIAGAQDATPSADRRAIDAIRAEWAGHIAADNAAAIEEIYADDAVLMAPGEPPFVGVEAIGTRLRRQLALPDLTFKFDPQALVIAQSGDLAQEWGQYEFAATLPQGPITDTGNYVLVWQKRDGDWKVITDIFNSNPAQ